MPTVDATVGGASANSYATVGETDTYLDTRLNAGDYTGASADDKARALIEATRELDRLPWIGLKVTDTQALAWPRDFAVDPDATISDPALDFPYFADDVIPQRVKDATMELALEFLRAGTTDVAALPSDAGIQSESVGPLSTTYLPGNRPRGLNRFPRVLHWLAPLLEGTNQVVRA